MCLHSQIKAIGFWPNQVPISASHVAGVPGSSGYQASVILSWESSACGRINLNQSQRVAKSGMHLWNAAWYWGGAPNVYRGCSAHGASQDL